MKIFEFVQGLAKHGSEYVRELFLRPSIAGDQVACLGVSEPGAGSDVAQEGVQKDFFGIRSYTSQFTRRQIGHLKFCAIKGCDCLEKIFARDQFVQR